MAKSKWEEVKEKLLLIEAWARDGCTIEDIACKLGISKVTLYKYANEHYELSERLKKGKEYVDVQVENALLKRAIGYRYNEVTQERVLNEETGEVELAVTKIVTKEVTPDTTAQIFWLKNRRRDIWRDNPATAKHNEEMLKIKKEELEIMKQRYATTSGEDTDTGVVMMPSVDLEAYELEKEEFLKGLYSNE